MLAHMLPALHEHITKTPLPAQTKLGCTAVTMAHLGMRVTPSPSLGQAGAELLLPSLCPKADIQSVCCLHLYILTALPPENCLQPIQAFCMSQLSSASCSLLFLLPAGAALATQPLLACSRTVSTAMQQHRGCM